MISKPIKEKIFIPEYVTKGWLPNCSRHDPCPRDDTWRIRPFENVNFDTDRPYFLPKVKEIYPSLVIGIDDPEVSLPVLMKKYQKSLKKK